MTDGKESFFTKLWNTHILGNKPGEMADTAQEALEALEAVDFTELDKAESFQKLVRDIFVGQLAEVKRSPSWQAARIKLLNVLALIEARFPVSDTQREAEKRLKYWVEGMPGDDPVTVLLRDMFDLMRIVVQLVPEQQLEQELIKLFAGIRALLEQFARDSIDVAKANERSLRTKQDAEEKFDTPSEIRRGALMYLLEDGQDYSEAKQAYYYFMMYFGPGRPQYMPDQVITISARMLGRAVDEGDFEQARVCLAECTKVVASRLSDPQLPTKEALQYAGLMLRDLLKNPSRWFKDRVLNGKYAKWVEDAGADGEFRTAISAMVKLQFLGSHRLRTSSLPK